MFKHIVSKLAIAIAALGVCAASASAADIYNQGVSTKDGPHTPDTRSDRSGWALRAFIGYASGERDIKSEANAFLNCTNAYELSEDPDERATQLKEIDEFVAEANAAGVFASTSNDGTLANIVVPILGAFFNNSDSNDFNSVVFGGEVEYLQQMGRFGLALNVGVTAYADANSTTTFANVPTFFERGTLTNPANGQNNGFDGPTGLTVSGYASVERQLDIDLTLKPYYFFTPNFAIFGKVGPSFAKAKIKGGVSIDGTDESLEYENDDWSIGYVLGLGVTKWWDENWSTTLEGDWKAHSFDASGKRSVSLGGDHCCDQYTIDAAGKTDVDDNVWTVKLGSAYHF